MTVISVSRISLAQPDQRQYLFLALTISGSQLSAPARAPKFATLHGPPLALPGAYRYKIRRQSLLLSLC